MRFANGFVNHPVCCVSRSSLLTGRYSHNTHVLNNSAATRKAAIVETATTASEVVGGSGSQQTCRGVKLNLPPASDNSNLLWLRCEVKATLS